MDYSYCAKALLRAPSNEVNSWDQLELGLYQDSIHLILPWLILSPKNAVPGVSSESLDPYHLSDKHGFSYSLNLQMKT